ncbi:MAG: NADH-quinone oxidoreductase subunit NuoF [Myxococcales bacterium]|nr:MAG: NADH-quinone oxidoreductase subunit NuoF [Myxococcales bacterium]
MTAEFNISKVLGEKGPAPDVQDWMAAQRRERLTRPVVFIGAGTCGLGAGAAKTMAAVQGYLQERRIDAEVVKVGCIGLCSAEPLVDLQLPGKCRLSLAHVTADKVVPYLDALFAGAIPEKAEVFGQFRAEGLEPWAGAAFLDELPFFKPQTRLVLRNCGIISPVSLAEYLAHGGYQPLAKVLRTMSPEQVCNDVEKSGLRGRGGGGFPTGMKWKLARKNPAPRYLVCNADEGDPGAYMDRAVIEGDPHRLLEGMAIAAYGIGAETAYVYIRAEYPLAIEHLVAAIAEAREHGLLGENILGKGLKLDIRIKKGAGAFVCGEETALMHSIEGKRGEPRPRPPFPAQSGLWGHPTIINNVETLANLPSIFEKGADWFAAMGTRGSKGTKVFALSGKISRTGLVEVVMGTTVRSIIEDVGGGVPNGKAFKAVQMGGPSGGCVPAQRMDIEIDYESLKSVGAIMGSGGMVVMDEDTCMVDVARFFMDFVQRESCGKCVPCRVGTKRMLEALTKITDGKADLNDPTVSLDYLRKMGTVTIDTSLCGLGQTAPNPLLSTLRWFRDEYETHLHEHRCPAKVCRPLLTFEIDAQKCTGCTLCAIKCPAEAIQGEKKKPHRIDQAKCVRCGTCVDVCRFDAATAK